MNVEQLKKLGVGMEQLAKIRTLERIEARLAEHAREVKKLKEQETALETKLRAIQRECPHYLTTYHPDASGNNDSTTVCDTCGRHDL